MYPRLFPIDVEHRQGVRPAPEPSDLPVGRQGEQDSHFGEGEEGVGHLEPLHIASRQVSGRCAHPPSVARSQTSAEA